MENIKIYPNKARLVFITFLGIMMTAASVYITLFIKEKGITFSLSGAIGGITGFGILLSISYYKTRKSSDTAKELFSLYYIKYFLIFVLIMVSGLLIDERIYFFIVGLIGTAFFGLCTSYFIYRIIKNTPSLEMTAKGIIYNSSMTSVGQVSWNEIKEVFTYVEMNNKMLAIVPYDMNDIRSRQGKIQKLLTKKQKFISIAHTTVSMSLEELEEEMKLRISLINN
ncbi:STM3941 family protein [Oceanirhabdus sp. W0125-5]|uniref:STM3941 family protein n=1 Tax=Oceanirhabdus sp. W0125-5 TaxID=2999116 RepID=UPI0022F2EFC2|nr:STM3941 family protein [Oceanirhabdus sp. W0125-5]WBW99035.1 hypothetical protein OW730_09895 [Oceanirhabdus sp. W0125-5]